jgi:hypothetical protein
VLLAEGFLHGMKRPVRGQPLDRRDGLPVSLHGQHRARLHDLAVEVDSARTALRRVACDLRPRQPDVVTDEVG